MALDPKKMLSASVLIIAIGVVLVISSIILNLLPMVITGPEADTISLASTIYSFLLMPVYLVLYFWGGYRASKTFKLDAVGAGLTAAISFVVVAIGHLLIDVLLSLIFLSGAIAGGTYVSTWTVLASQVFGPSAAGSTGILLSALCGAGAMLVGALINFAVGGAGSLLAQR